MTTGLDSSEAAALTRMGEGSAPSVSERLNALSRVVEIASERSRPDGFSRAVLADAEELLARAGERLRLSANHTVVVMAGGTGSGKSSLFNLLAGADFSPVGMTRPVTRAPHACVWGMTGAGALLDWIGIEARYRYARSSALDDGERGLTGLVLLDLPDHDSVLAEPSHGVSRLISLADLMVWVLDPQKYADASVHSRYLVPMAGHSAVITVVLNQADRLPREQMDDCLADLQRLLDSEGLHESRITVTSAVTGEGVDELRQLLMEAVTARESAAARIGADVDAIAARFAPYVGSERDELPESMRQSLIEEFAQAAGVAGVCRTLASVRELRAADYVGWPVSWLVSRALRGDPARRMRLGALWDELRGVTAGPADAQVAEIDNAVTAFADAAAEGLPAPWPATVRDAARAGIDDVAAELGAAAAKCLPAEDSVAPWWRLAAAWQGVLLGGAVTGLMWLAGLLAVGVGHVTANGPAIFTNTGLLPWAGLMVVALTALGWLSEISFMTLVVRGAERERQRAQEEMRERVAGVAAELVTRPVEAELAVCGQFREEFAVAAGS